VIKSIRRLGIAGAAVLILANTASVFAADQPNILVIWGDDVGLSNISYNSRGMMGYRTPNIDRIGNEGMAFTDYYGEQSCTAGRSSFIMGQSVFRTGLSKVGLPGAKEGMQEEDPTIAVVLKDLGYATGQFGKNHLGDRDEHLPTNHGFDEFLGNLYHLNAEEEPENEDYPASPEFRKKYGPRGVIHSFSDGRIEDTGPLTKKRMETVDDETAAAALDFIDRQHAAGKPWFVWWSGTRMHFRTHVSDERMAECKAKYPKADEYQCGMVEHDMHIGQFLDKLDELGITDNTVVFYSTDNGPHMNTWPDAAELGRWLARARLGALARQDSGRANHQRDRAPHGLAADLCRHRRQGRHQGRPDGRLPLVGTRTQVQGAPGRLQHHAAVDR
jgi:arylsulfatase